jgi:predicted esterase
MKTTLSLAAAGATLFAPALLCRAGEVSYLETFSTYPYAMVLTNHHAEYPDWPNGDLNTARSNGVLRAWAMFQPYKLANPILNLKSLEMNRDGEIMPGRDLEIRADVLRVIGDGAFASLGWQLDGFERTGYFFLKGREDVALVKHCFDQGIFAPFFWEHLPVTDRPVTMVLRFQSSQAGLAIQARLLEAGSASRVIFERTVMDTPGVDAVSTAPALLAASSDPGPAWRGTGPLTLSLFGVVTNSWARLEMEVANFGMRQTREVTENDFIPLVFTNKQRQTLAYRLFVPAHLEARTLYPLVLHLHGGEGPGDDNLRQFRHPDALVFVSPANQAKHPCFMVSPQVSSEDSRRYPEWTWGHLRERLVGMLTNLLAQYPIDPDRLYLTGYSMGGVGTFRVVDAYPGLFAAAVPMAGLSVGNSSVTNLTRVPMWVFHGAQDQTVPVDALYTDPAGSGLAAKGSRGLVADIRRFGGCPIYTEYSRAGHDMFWAAYNTPGLVDWLMAQRRAQRVHCPPWIQVTTPSSSGLLTTSYTNLDLAGTACAEEGITNVAWRNESLHRTGRATGTTNWTGSGIPLSLGRITATGVVGATNVITVTATSTNWCELCGGATTFNTTLTVVQVPLR